MFQAVGKNVFFQYKLSFITQLLRFDLSLNYITKLKYEYSPKTKYV